MAKAQKSNSSVVTVRPKGTIALPPGTLGFASLVTPDEYDPEKPTFKLNYHLSPEGIPALRDDIAEKVYTEASMEKLREECALNGISKVPEPQDPEAWLAGKLKEPKETAKLQLPHIVISNRATYKKNGETVQREIACWDMVGNKLNLKKLRLGMGSLIQPVVFGNLFFSKLIGIPQPSLKLVGIKVLKLERWGGGAAPPETDEEAIKEVLGENFAYDNLSQFASGAGDADEEHGDEDLSPDQEASRLFGGGN